MNKFYLIALIAAFTSFAAHAEPAAVPTKPVQAVPTATTTKISQQDKMRECSKQATGKKGAERRAFMKTCLSRKA